MSLAERYQPTVNDLISWARRRSDHYGRESDVESAFTADQMTRIVGLLETFPFGMAASAWTPVEQFTPKPHERVLLRLLYNIGGDMPGVVEYDVGFWRHEPAGWMKCRAGIVTHCARINELLGREP